MRFTQVFTFLFCLLFSQTGIAEKIYLEYSSDCMDIYEYHYNGNTSGMGHMVYHIALNDLEKIVLEVGVEAKLNQPRKPSKTKSCNDLSLNERMVRRINNGEVDLFIVRKDGRGYNVSPVGIASYAQINGTSTGISTLDTRFSYNFSQPANGINIATNGSNAKVFYKGVVSNSCPKKYLFNKTRQKGGRSYSEFVIIPEIGVVEEKNGFNATDAQNSVLRLIKVNGIALERYLNTYCQDSSAGVNKVFYTNGSFNNRNKVAGNKPSLAELESGNSSSNSSNTNGNSTHGGTRTHYGNNNTTTGNVTYITDTGVSNCKVYKDLDRGVYVDWNTGQVANTQCGGNTYVNGRMIGEVRTATIVTAPPPPPPTRVIPTRTPTRTEVYTPPPPPKADPIPVYSSSNCSDVSTYGNHIVQRNETLYSIARNYGLSLAQIRSYNPGLRGDVIHPCMKLMTKSNSGSNSSVVATDYKAQHHTVRKGETLYQLASKYGYTVDRFRKLNGISSTGTIHPGQTLKTQDCNCPAPSTAPVNNSNNNRSRSNTTTSSRSSRDIASNNSRFVPSEYNVPGSRIDTEKGARKTTGKRRFHVVKEDDTVYSISKQFGITVSQLRRINDLEENEIIIPYQRIYLEK